MCLQVMSEQLHSMSSGFGSSSTLQREFAGSSNLSRLGRAPLQPQLQPLPLQQSVLTLSALVLSGVAVGALLAMLLCRSAGK